MASGMPSEKEQDTGRAENKYQKYRSHQERGSMKIQKMVMCKECMRLFDLLDEKDAEEFYYGHDCEEPEEEE